MHGGAGAAPGADAAAQQRACDEALAIAWAVLTGGGSALEAVTRAVVHLENAPTLNAGHGACLTAEGGVELDASVMEGTTRRAGAVALVRRVANPVVLARSLLEGGPHMFMAGPAAEAIAEERGIRLVDPQALVTPARRAAWEHRRNASGTGTAGAPSAGGKDPTGTVGAVALDGAGRCAAATSTGGIADKLPGRIGDSAVIGAGTYADDRLGCASSTGFGEAIMRATLARTAVEQLRGAMDPAGAAARALAEVTAVGGDAGVILLDRFGRVAAAHTTPHMIAATRWD